MDNFATELLTEVKRGVRRWFIAFIIVTTLWFITIVGFVWYISLPVDSVEISDVTQDSGDGGNNIVSGGDIANGDTDSGENLG